MLNNVAIQTLIFLVGFEVFMAGTMKNGVFWDVTPCSSSQNTFLQEPHGVTSQKAPFSYSPSYIARVNEYV
jgi:hypothetical protein